MSILRKIALSIILAFVTASPSFAGNNAEIGDTGMVSILLGVMVFLIVLIVVVSDSIKNLSKYSKAHLKKDNQSNKTGETALKTLLILGFSLTGSNLFAANDISEPFIKLTDDLFIALVTINCLLFVFLLYLLSLLRTVINTIKPKSEAEEEEPDFIESIAANLTGAVPIEKEEDILMDHEYDGIKELDNNLPPWWVYMFYITILFGVVYIIHYHISPVKAFEKVGIIGPGVGQEQLYTLEMEEAEKQKAAYMERMANAIDEGNVTLLTDATLLSKGADIFKANCTPCHGQVGEGNTIGPNLTDQYWLHGGGIKNVFSTIKYGVPIKGMREWQSQFSPSQIQQVASYIMSLQGSNPPNAKEPQGEVWTEVEVSTADSLQVIANENDSITLN